MMPQELGLKLTRRYRARTMSTLLTCVAAMALAAWPACSFAQSAHGLAGQWTLNKKQSDNAEQKVQDAEQSVRRAPRTNSGGGYPGRGGGYPGGGYPGGRYPGGSIGFPGGRIGIPGGGMGRGRREPMGGASRQAPQQNLEPLATTPETLTITPKGNGIRLVDDNGEITTLAGDGKKHKEKDPSGKKFTVKSHWDVNRLISERKLKKLGKLTESYQLSPDRKELIVVSRLDDSQLSAPLVIRRVYDREAPANAQ